MKRQKPAVGQLFIVPLSDRSGVVGQIVGREARMLNSWTCAFSHIRVSDAANSSFERALRGDDLISVLFVTGDLLKNGMWRICSHADVLIPAADFPHEELRSSGWIGATMRGSGIVQTFLAAYFGLGFWDAMKDPAYYDSLLLPRISRPHGIKTKTA